MSKKKKYIYHYCSLEAFYSIIKTKSFWLFSLSSSNDPEELTEAGKIIDKVLSEEKYKSIEKFDHSGHYEFYSLSCTSERDSALHFNKYADNDKGVCFGIDTDVFKKYLMHISQTDSYFDFFFFPKVIYNDKQKEKKIRKYLDDRLRFIEHPENSNIKGLSEKVINFFHSEQGKDGLRKLISITVLSCFEPKLKIINYRNEFETRMLFGRIQFQLCKHFFEGKSDENDFYNIRLKRAKSLNMDSSPEFRVMSGVRRECIELKMETIWDKQPIKEVILGPNCKTDIEEFDGFLESNGVLCKAKPSEIKNRKWT